MGFGVVVKLDCKRPGPDQHFRTLHETSMTLFNIRLEFDLSHMLKAAHEGRVSIRNRPWF